MVFIHLVVFFYDFLFIIQIIIHEDVIIKKSSMIFMVNFIKEKIKIKCFIIDTYRTFFRFKSRCKNEQKLCI